MLEAISETEQDLHLVHLAMRTTAKQGRLVFGILSSDSQSFCVAEDGETYPVVNFWWGRGILATFRSLLYY